MPLRLPAAFLVLTLSVASFGQNASGPVQAIQAALRARDFTQALELANSALKQSPRDAKLWMLQGVSEAGLGKNKEALISFHKALSISPNNLPALWKEAVETLRPLLDIKEPEPDVLALASSAYEVQGDTPKAVQLLRQAIVANPKKIKYYLDFATLSFNHQSFQVGVDMVNVGLKQLPDAASLYVARWRPLYTNGAI